MGLTFLQSFCIPTIVGICLCVGHVIKYSLTFIQNKYIPLIMALLGLILNIFFNGAFTADNILGGLFSGLASTGVHQVFKEIIGVERSTNDEENN